MQIELWHPLRAGYPEPDTDWKALGVYPIGVIREGSSDPWLPLVLDSTRQPHAVIDGKLFTIEPDAFARLFFTILDETCERLWGHEWNSGLAEVFGINRRSTQRDRVTSNLLPPKILMTIAYVASADDSRPLAAMLRAVAKVRNHFKNATPALVERHARSAIDIAFELEDDVTLGL